MPREKMPRYTITQSLINFLKTKKKRGATLQEIYAAVNADSNLSEIAPDTTVRGIIYQNLPGGRPQRGRAKAKFERFVEDGQTRYRLL